MIIYILVMKILATSLVNSDPASDNEEARISGPDPLDEWHMDFVPTGYLPDSVYRELAWYGILQVQPLYRSTKHKVAAQWIWQNTLGRPYVIVENQPQSMLSENTVSHQSIAEESAKWSRERRLAQDVLMENIRSGGNGLTVRTVISATRKTAYIIQNGKYFSCEEDSEPDVEAFREQTNVHERKCTSGKEAVPLPLQVDPCIDAEAAPLEYSYIYGWMFCLGDGERESSYSPDGDVDCGKKIKIRFSDFLRDCAIDNNVVISYEYFGDEPRKDIVHNTTLCTTWDPCRISYLYRIEAPDTPEIPTSSPDLCDTTICPECVKGFSEDYVDPLEATGEDRKIANESLREGTYYQWVPTSLETFEQVKKQAMVGGYLATGERLFIIRRTNFHGGYFIENSKVAPTLWIPDASTWPTERQNYFDVLFPKKTEFEWVPEGNCPENFAIRVGTMHHGKTYVCRKSVKGHLLPGSHYYTLNLCYVDTKPGTHEAGRAAFEQYEILCQTNLT